MLVARLSLRIALATMIASGAVVACGSFLGLSDDDVGGAPLDDGSAEAGADGASTTTGNVETGAQDVNTGPLSYREEVLVDQPIAYYRFEEKGGPDIIDEMNNHPGVLVGADDSARVTGIAGGDQALSLANDYVTINNGKGLLTFSNIAPMTLELWFQLTTFKGGTKHIAGHFESDGYRLVSDLSLRFERTTTSPTQTVQVGKTFGIDVPMPHHIVATFNGTTLYFYVDAIEASMTPTNLERLMNSTSPFTIGAITDGGERFGGVVDEVAIYGTSLSPKRVQAHFDARLRK